MSATSNLGLYWTKLPLILLGLAALILVAAGSNLSIWSQPWHRLAILAGLSFEMFFLPYFLLPLAVRIPLLAPWCDFRPEEEFGIDGENRIRQRSIVIGFIVVSGMATLSAYGSAAPSSVWYMEMGWSLLNGAVVPLLSAAALSLFLVLPDVSPQLQRIADWQANRPNPMDDDPAR